MSTVYFALLCGAVICILPMVNADCPAWSSLSQTMTSRREIEMKCHVHPSPCYGLDCSGTYRFTFTIVELPVIKKEIDFCLGIQINECSRPPSMDVHIQVPETNSVFSQRFMMSDTRQMNMTYTIYTGVAEADGFANVTFVPTSKYFLIGVMLKIRVTMFGRDMWPTNAQRQLVPVTKMPRATCPSTSVAPPLQPSHECTPLTWVSIQPPQTGTTVGILSPTYHKPCPMNTLNNTCVHNEICEANGYHAATGRCVCDQGRKFSPYSGKCQTQGDEPFTRSPTVTAKTGNTTTQSLQIITTKGSTTAIIVGSVVGGVVLFGFVVLVAIFYYRRRNAPYRNHESLLSNDDDIM